MNSNINKLVLMTSEELKAELHNILIEQKKEILKELESIEVSLNDNDTDTASIDLHFLIVEILDKINNDA